MLLLEHGTYKESDDTDNEAKKRANTRSQLGMVEIMPRREIDSHYRRAGQVSTVRQIDAVAECSLTRNESVSGRSVCNPAS